MSGEADYSPRVVNRWWVDQGKLRDRPSLRRAGSPLSLFRAAEGYEQAKARERLTDLNAKLLAEAPPPPGGWSRLCLAERPSPPRALAQVERALRLPSGARALLVDFGDSVLRAILTGAPPGEKVVELNLGGAPSLDAWIGNEWVGEEVFDSVQDALARASTLIERYLGPGARAAP